MRVELPVESAAEVEVDVQPRRLLLRVPGRLQLDLPLPIAVRAASHVQAKELAVAMHGTHHAFSMPSWQSRVLLQRAPGTAAANCGARVLDVYRRYTYQSSCTGWCFPSRTGSCDVHPTAFGRVSQHTDTQSHVWFLLKPCMYQVHAILFA